MHNTCEHKNKKWSETYDAVFCRDCREWLESKCVDEEICQHCISRPLIAPNGLEDDEHKKRKHLEELLSKK